MSKNLRILLVEDNPGDADLILELLPSTGSLRNEIEHVTKMATALKRVGVTHFDVILLDLGLPDSSGLETVRSMREGSTNTPIVVMTGNHDDQLGVDAIKTGAQDFVVKGEVNSTLLSRVLRFAVERHLSAELVRRSESQWSSLVKTIPDFVALHDIKGNYLFLNHYAKGFSEKDIVGKNAFDFIMPKSKSIFKSNFNRCLKSKTTQFFEYTALGDLKTPRTYENFLVPILEEDRVVNILSIARDVTERKKAEEALLRSEENFRNLFENSTVGLYRTTPNGKILLANPTLVKMLGYESFEELAKRNLEKEGFEPGHKRNEFKKRVENDTFVQGLEIAWKKKDGSEIFVRESSKAIRDAGGKVQYYEGTVEDITQRKKAEKELARSAQALQGRNADLERFNKAAVGRELRMIELKKQINELSKKCGQPAPYSVSESDEPKPQKSRTKK